MAGFCLKPMRSALVRFRSKVDLIVPESWAVNFRIVPSSPLYRSLIRPRQFGGTRALLPPKVGGFVPEIPDSPLEKSPLSVWRTFASS